jgi:hypothetical protein
MNEITVASDKVVAFPNAREGISDHVILAQNKLHLEIETTQLVVHPNVVASECRRRRSECLERLVVRNNDELPTNEVLLELLDC